MEHATGPALRWARAAVLAAVAMFCGVVAHVTAGGLLPGTTAMFVLFAVILMATASLLGRPASTLRVTLVLIAGQTIIHGALTALAGHRGDPVVAPTNTPLPAAPAPGTPRVGSFYDQVYGAAQHSGAQHTGAHEPLQLTVPAPVQHLLADMTGPHAAMALAHLVAVAVIGLWLAAGERMLWTIVVLTRDHSRALVNKALLAAYRAVAQCALEALAAEQQDGMRWRRAEEPPPRQTTPRPLSRRGPPPAFA